MKRKKDFEVKGTFEEGVRTLKVRVLQGGNQHLEGQWDYEEGIRTWSHVYLKEIRNSRGVTRGNQDLKKKESSRRESEPRRQGHLEEGIWITEENLR